MSGIDNCFADYLSQIPKDKLGTAYKEDPETPPFPMEVAGAESIQLQSTSVEAIADLQKQYPEIQLILSGDTPKNTKFEERDFSGVKLICEVSLNQPRPFVPKPLRTQIMSSLHSLEHP